MENSPGDSGFSNSQGSGHSGTPGRSLCGTGPRYQGSISLQTYDGPGIDQFAHSVRTDPRSLFKGRLRNHQFEAGSGWRRNDGGDGDPFAEGIEEEIILERGSPWERGSSSSRHTPWERGSSCSRHPPYLSSQPLGPKKIYIFSSTAKNGSR